MDATKILALVRTNHPDDDTIEAHYGGLERAHSSCACLGTGFRYVGRVVESPHDLDGEVVEYERRSCHRCREEAR